MWYDNLIPRKIESLHEFNGFQSTITAVSRGWQDRMFDPKDPALFLSSGRIRNTHRNIEAADKINVMWAYAMILMQAHYKATCPNTILTIESVNRKVVEIYNTEIAIADATTRPLGIFFESLLTMSMDSCAIQPPKYPLMVFGFIADSFREPMLEVSPLFSIDGNGECNDLFYNLFHRVVNHFMETSVTLPLFVHKILDQRLIKEKVLQPDSLEQYLLEQEQLETKANSIVSPVMGFRNVYGFATAQTQVSQSSYEHRWGLGKELGSAPIHDDGSKPRDLIKQLAQERRERQKNTM